jgi:hypothetical protein
MDTSSAVVRPDRVGMAATAFALLGVVLCRWLPIGMILSMAGLVLGVCGWLMTRGTGGRGWVVAGVLISLAALVLNVVIVRLNLDTFTLSNVG